MGKSTECWELPEVTKLYVHKRIIKFKFARYQESQRDVNQTHFVHMYIVLRINLIRHTK